MFCLPRFAQGDASSPATSGSEKPHAATLGDRYIETFQEQQSLQARLDFCQLEAQRLQTAIQAGPRGENVLVMLGSVDAPSKSLLAAMLQDGNQPLVADLARAAQQADAQTGNLVEQWRPVRLALNDRRQQLFEVQASRRVAGQLASLLSVDNRWFWLCGVVAVASLVAVAGHERRHEIRRFFNGGRARRMGLSKLLSVLLVLLGLVTAATFAFGNQIYRSLLLAGSGLESSPRDAMEQELREVEGKSRELKEELSAAEEKCRQAQADYRKAFAPSALEQPLVDQAGQSREWIEKIAVAQAVQLAVAQRLAADLKDLDQVEEQVAATGQEIVSYQRAREAIRGGLGATLAGVALFGGVLLRQGIARNQRRIRNTCPLCLSRGTFESAAQTDADGETIGGDMVRCKHVISRHPYEECNFTFLSMYRQFAKLCFPTLGIPQVGKTHWLAMVYRELNRGDYPRWIQFEKVQSSSSGDFDRVVDEILNKRVGPMATQVARIPHPLVFNFLDRDRLGASNVLVNIFDYSGEVIRSQSIEDRQRRRALDADGFFFFLDPTEPSETQSQALAGFREDLRRVRGVRAGKEIRTPVALCVSKIDLMAGQRYAGDGTRGAIGKFYEELAEIGWELDLASIEARSSVLRQLRDTVWPGWNIERQIRDLFGGRHMFFPLTPVGMDGAGDSDLSRRTIAPLGLIEPLVWLLHMNGYPVLN